MIKHFFHSLYVLSLPNVIFSAAILLIVIPLYENYVGEEIEFVFCSLQSKFAWEVLKLEIVFNLIYYVPSAIITYIVWKKFDDIHFSKWDHWMILSLQPCLIVRPITYLLITLSSPEPTRHHLLEDQLLDYVVIFLPLIQMFYQLYMFKPEYVVFKHFWSPLSDIYQALSMVAYQINPENPTWVNILVAVNVTLFMILSFSHIYLYRFPQLARMIPREVKNAQFVLFCIFLVVRSIFLVKWHGDLIFTARLLYRFLFDILPEFVFEQFELALYRSVRWDSHLA